MPAWVPEEGESGAVSVQFISIHDVPANPPMPQQRAHGFATLCYGIISGLNDWEPEGVEPV